MNGRVRGHARDQPAEIRDVERDAPLGWCKFRAVDVHENSAAQMRTGRMPVMIKDHDQIIEPVAPPQMLGARPVWLAHRLVIGRIMRRIAPSIAPPDCAQGQLALRRHYLAGPVKNGFRIPDAKRRRPISLALIIPDTAPPEHAFHAPTACLDPPICGHREVLQSKCPDFDFLVSR